jgi:hypothetical protein
MVRSSLGHLGKPWTFNYAPSTARPAAIDGRSGSRIWDRWTNWISRCSVTADGAEMTQRMRRKIDAALKTKIALEALRGQATVADLAQR